MKIAAIICRVLLGLLFVVSGANILHPFMPAPPPMAEPMATWSHTMMTSGWMSAVGFFQLLGGLLVLFGGTAPLGLCILCPITVNILLCHICLMGGKGIGAGIATAVFELVLIGAYRASFAGILTAKASVSGARL